MQLAVTEIRHFGGESIQVARRLRAMLENLIETLPAKAQLAVLRDGVGTPPPVGRARFNSEPEDRAMAEIGDSQGVGGKGGHGFGPAPGNGVTETAIRPDTEG